MKRVLIVLAALVVGVAAIGVFGQVRRADRESGQREAAARYAAVHPLEVSAATIDADRRIGEVANFALVPPGMPPGIVKLMRSDPLIDDGVTDVYSYGDGQVIVNFTGTPGDRPCGDQPCVRDAALTVSTPDAPGLRHVAVWLTGAPRPDDPEVRRFWAGTTWVPIAKAGWFTDLAMQGAIHGPMSVSR